MVIGMAHNLTGEDCQTVSLASFSQYLAQKIEAIYLTLRGILVAKQVHLFRNQDTTQSQINSFDLLG